MSSIIAIKDVVPGQIKTFACPFARVNLIPFGGRSTAIKLKDGSVFLSASSPLDEATKTHLKELGPVKYIIALDVEHHLSLSSYLKEYPDARLIGVEPLIAKRPDLKFDGVFGRDEAPLGPELSKSGEIQAEYFSAHRNSDVAIFHPDSKTLVEADILFNLPALESYSKSGGNPHGIWPISILVKKMQPFNPAHQSLISRVATDKAAYAASVKRVAAWDFDRIIPCHGDILEGNGKAAWEAGNAQFLA